MLVGWWAERCVVTTHLRGRGLSFHGGGSAASSAGHGPHAAGHAALWPSQSAGARCIRCHRGEGAANHCLREAGPLARLCQNARC